MLRLLWIAVGAVTLIGCSAGSQPAENAAQTAVAQSPTLILEFTDQTTAWQCGTCGMVFDGPGECSMKCETLKEVTVTYACPTDGKAFEAAGMCPEHDVEIEAHTAFVTQADDAEHAHSGTEEG